MLRKIWHEAARPDSFVSYGFEQDFITNEGDTVVVDFYRSYAPIGDTITANTPPGAWSGGLG